MFARSCSFACLLLMFLAAVATAGGDAEILIRLVPGAHLDDQAGLRSWLDREGLSVLREIVPPTRAPAGRIVKLLAPDGARGADELAAELASQPGVVGATVNRTMHLCLLPNDPMLSTQWHVNDPGDRDVRLPEAWDIRLGDPSTVIAILDTGVDTGHPDLQAAMWTNPGEIAGNGLDDDGNGWIDDVHGWDCGNNDPDPRPEVYQELGIDVGFHGTHCAGIAAATTSNGVGIAGAGWGCSLMALKMNNSASVITVEALTDGVLYATANGAAVISMSFGGDLVDFNFMESLLADAAAAGVVCVAAAGNDNSATMLYPAAFPGVIAVGATDPTGARASFSTYGAWVDVAAPGQQIWSTVQSNYEWDFLTQLLFMLSYGWDGINPYMYSDGTSMACPLVAGVCGLIKSERPDFTQEQVRARLIETGRDDVVFDQPIGVLVDAHAALSGLDVVAVTPSPLRAPGLFAAPNPFNPSVAITYRLPQSGRARLTVHDLRGRLVATLQDGWLEAGEHAAVWNGTDQRGLSVASGSFLVRLDSGRNIVTRTIALIE